MYTFPHHRRASRITPPQYRDMIDDAKRQHHPASFKIMKSAQTGNTLYTSERAGLQDFYNGWAAFWGLILPWSGIAVAAYYGVHALIG